MSCGNSRSSKCNPCGPSEDAMNAIAERAAYYARIAQYAADQVGQFNTVYLGEKATAPTVDNSGDALIVGALYFNTTSNAMFVWNGSSWDFVNQDIPTEVNAMGIVSKGISLFAQQTNAASRQILRANPVDGGRLVINGVTRQFQSGLTLDTTMFNANTLYYVYAYWTGSAIALDLSTTAWSYSFALPHPGLAIKTGDPTQTLVGLVWLDSNKELVNNSQNNSIINWYNQKLNFLAGQLSANLNNPDTWLQFSTPITSRYNPADPFNAANWQELGTDTDNKITWLSWRPLLGRLDAITMGLSGSVSIDGEDQRVRYRFGTTSRGPNFPISSDMSSSSPSNFFFSNASGVSTIGSSVGTNTEGRHEFNLWGQIIATGKSATGDAATDLVTVVGNTYQNGFPVRFTSLTGGAGLSEPTIPNSRHSHDLYSS